MWIDSYPSQPSLSLQKRIRRAGNLVLLFRADVIGNKIEKVLQTPEQETPPGSGYFSCDAFVRLENGNAFSLNVDDSVQNQVESIAIRDGFVRDVFKNDQENCCGDVIEEVFVSDLWGPYLILLLSSGRVLTIGASPWLSGPLLIAAKKFSFDDAEDFWKRCPT